MTDGTLARRKPEPYIGTMNLELTDEQADALERELRRIIDDDRYPLSPRIQMLREIRNMIHPNPSANRSPNRGITSRRAADDTVDAVIEIRIRPADEQSDN